MVKTLFAALAIAALMACCKCSVVHAAARTVTLDVPGMTCVTCPIAVRKALSRVDGVTLVDVSFETKQATVTFDDARTTVNALTQATASAGFPSSVKE